MPRSSATAWALALLREAMATRLTLGACCIPGMVRSTAMAAAPSTPQFTTMFTSDISFHFTRHVPGSAGPARSDCPWHRVSSTRQERGCGRVGRMIVSLSPMLATLGSLAALSPGTTWRLEGKWDGVRAVATVDGGDLLLRSRTDREMTATYPELAELPGLLAHCPVTLDGEIVAFDSDDRTDFGLLQQRQGLRGPAVERIRLGVPVTYLIFDVLTRHRIQRCDARRPGRQTRSVAHRPITGVGTVATRCCGPGRSLGATGDGR